MFILQTGKLDEYKNKTIEAKNIDLTSQIGFYFSIFRPQ